MQELPQPLASHVETLQVRQTRPASRQLESAPASRQAWPQNALLVQIEAHDWHTPKAPHVLDALAPHGASQRDADVHTWAQSVDGVPPPPPMIVNGALDTASSGSASDGASTPHAVVSRKTTAPKDLSEFMPGARAPAAPPRGSPRFDGLRVAAGFESHDES